MRRARACTGDAGDKPGAAHRATALRRSFIVAMTIAKISAGDGYLYLLRHTARGDGTGIFPGPNNDGVRSSAVDYYLAEGTPPGRWTGRGAPLLGVDGQVVTEEQMTNLFGVGEHPNADAVADAYYDEHVRPGMTSGQRYRVRQAADRHARLGRQFPLYEQLEPFDDRAQKRLDFIREQAGREPTAAEVRKAKADEAHRQRGAVAGYDLVFSPIKSASLLWAVDPRPEVREAIRAAHQRAVKDAMDFIEDNAAFTRTGTGGIAQIDTCGLTAAAFEHWDSRAGDPDLHTHMAVSSKVKGADGKWKSLDARGLFRLTVAASELYNTAFETHLTAALGVTFTARADTPKGREPVREIDGVPLAVIDHFSRRRAAIEKRYGELLDRFRQENGREPDAVAVHKLAQEATLETRPDKPEPKSLHDRQEAWREELTDRFGPDTLDRIAGAVPSSLPENSGPRQVPFPDLSLMSERIVAAVSARRSTWTRWNIRAEAERTLRAEIPGMSPEEHTEFAEILTDLAIDGGPSLCVEAPSVLDEPGELRRSDGQSVFTEHGAGRFTSQAVLDAEQRLLDATRTPTVNGLAGPSADAAVDGFEAVSGETLDPGQRALVTAFATDDRLLLAGIGPAGSGKTTAMRAYSHVLRQAGRRLIPLATSAAAADVLGRELRLPGAENLHKFIYEWTRGRAADRLRSGDPVPADLRKFAFRRGDVVLVDEAGMAGTLLLEQLVTIAATQGATVRLLGDDRQLSAVESGGALRLIATQPGTPELTVLHRFQDPAEGDATLKIRSGDGSAIDWYAGAGRIRNGSRDAMTSAAYDGWKADMLAGKTTLMAAASGTDVCALAARARADRVAAGQVEDDGIELHDGNRAGAGDWIITRDNDRRNSVNGGRDWVKNSDAWHVEQRHANGSLTVRNMNHGGRVTLSPEYVARYVELLYATTGHRAQGSTVDTAHPLITPGMSREMLYVLVSRARSCTTLYTVTHEQPFDTSDHTDQVHTDPGAYAAREILLNVIATDGTAISATETIRQAQDEAVSLSRLVPQYLHAAGQHAEHRHRDAAFEVFGDEAGQDLVQDPAWGSVVQRLHDAEAAGWTPQTLLTMAAGRRELDGADSVAKVMSWRIDAVLAETPKPPAAGTPAEPVTVAKDRIDALTGSLLGTRCAARARSETAWPALITALHRAEHAGHPTGEILRGIVEQRELDTAPSLSELLARRVTQRVLTAAGPSAESRATAQEDRSVRNDEILPWVTRVPAGPAEPGTLPTYLNEAAEAISVRVEEIAERAIRERPAWMAMLGQQPDAPGQRAEWRRHVASVSAYRDQFRVQSEDPRQVLGPYPAEGHTGHGPYRHAAESVLAARQVAGLDVLETNPATAQVAIDVYRSLPESERAQIASAIAAQAGPLWLGNRDHPDADTVTLPGYADRLTAALTERGHLNSREPGQPDARSQKGEPVEASLARRNRDQRLRRGVTPNRPAPARPYTPAASRIPLQQPPAIQYPAGPVPGR